MRYFFTEVSGISVCAREFNETNVVNIKQQFAKPIVFVSVGRSVELAEAIDVSSFDYQFIVTEGIQLVGNNVFYLSKEVKNTQDYIKASDMVITKAGFGTVAETMLAKKRCAVIGRDSVAEDRATVQGLVERGLALKVDYRHGLDMEQILNHLENFEPRFDLNPFTNDARKIAKLLVRMCESHRLISLSSFGNEEMGYLVPLDREEFPFQVKRVFYLVDVPQGAMRGKHAYHESQQVLICVHGKVKVKCTIDEEETIYELNDSKVGLFLQPEVWREAYEFSEGAVLLVVSSKEFSEGDYKRKKTTSDMKNCGKI